MNVFRLIATGVILAAILAINYRPDKSRFEINRLAAHNHQYRVEARFLEIWPGLRNFLRLLALADAVALTIFAFAAWGASGGLLAFATILVAFLVARMFHKIAARLVARHLATLNKYFGWTKVLGELMVAGDDPQLASSHELLHLVEKADFLSPDQTSLMRAAAGLDQLIATDIMTPRDQIVFVRDRDVLGPKLLDELHQSGHEVFPVVRGNMEHVVGTLLLPDVLPLTQEEKQITTVMRPAPPILPEAAGLVEISRHFAKYHADQILVTGRQEKIVGLISFGNLTKALFDAAPQTD